MNTRIPGVLRAVLAVVLLFFLLSCSDSDMGFQDNRPATSDVEIFSLLDGHDTIKDALDGIDLDKLLAEDLPDAIKKNLEEFKTLAGIMTDLNNESLCPDKPMVATMNNLLALIEILQKENIHHNKPAATSFYNSYQTLDGFYSLLDTLTRDATEVQNPVDPVDEAVSIAETIIDYVKNEEGINTDTPEGVDELLVKLTDLLKEIYAGDIKDLAELATKMVLQADYYMYTGSSGDLVTDPKNITVNHTSIGFGNIAEGLHSTLMALNETVLKDSEIRDILYGKSGSSMMRNDLPILLDDDNATVFSKLIDNIQTYFLLGGSEYGDKTSSTDYYRDDGGIYYDAELTNTLRELWSPLQLLFIKDKSPGIEQVRNGADLHKHSIIYDHGKGRSPIEQLADNLALLDIDFRTYNLEKALTEAVSKDVFGKDRRSGGDTVSYLDHLLYTMGLSTEFGYFHDTGAADAGNNGGYGHGSPNGGIISLSDCLYNQGSSTMMNLLSSLIPDASMYLLCFDPPHGENLFRSKDPFQASESANYKFFVGPSSPANMLLPPQCIGDGGLPNGGTTVVNSLADYNTLRGNASLSPKQRITSYWPYNAKGFGDMNTARWVLGWVARVAWEGEGPYYYSPEKAGKTQPTRFIHGKTFNVYYNLNGDIYAYVNKPDPGDPATWEYIYPCGDDDTDAVVAEFTWREPQHCEFISSDDIEGGKNPANAGTLLSSFIELFGSTYDFDVKIGGMVKATVSFDDEDHSATNIRDTFENAINSALVEYNLDPDLVTVSLEDDASGDAHLKIVSEIGTIVIASAGSVMGNLVSILTHGPYYPIDQFLEGGAESWKILRESVAYNKLTTDSTVRVIVDNKQVDISFSLNETFSYGGDDYTVTDGEWTRDAIVAKLKSNADLAACVTKCGDGFVIRGTETDYNYGRVSITNVTGNAVAELFNATTGKVAAYANRPNRFSEKWRSDYHLFRYNMAEDGDPPEYLYVTTSNAGYDTNMEAGCYWMEELIQPEKFDMRECASKEEAIFKNVQWLLGEKKMIYFIPARIDTILDALGVISLPTKAAAFIIVEGNGLAGLANARACPPVTTTGATADKWLKAATKGKSFVPGDARLSFDMVNIKGIMSKGLVWGLLGNGHVLPEIVGANMVAMLGMTFPAELSDGTKQYASVTIDGKGIPMNLPLASSDYDDDTSSTPDVDEFWSERSKLLPVIAALAGALHGSTWYKKAETGYDYNYADEDKHRFPLKLVTNALLPPLAKPMLYYDSRNGATPPECWKPHHRGFSDYNTTGSGYYLVANQDESGNTQVDKWGFRTGEPGFYSPGTGRRTLMSILADADTSSPSTRADGLISLLGQTNAVSNLLALLARMGDETVLDGLYSGTGSPGKRLTFGLEQLLTSIKPTKGDVYTRQFSNFDFNEDKWKWLFQRRIDADFNLDDGLGDLNDMITNLVNGVTEEESLLHEGVAVEDELGNLPVINVATSLSIYVGAENLNVTVTDNGDGTASFSAAKIEDGTGALNMSTGKISFTLKNNPGTEKVLCSYSYNPKSTAAHPDDYTAVRDGLEFMEKFLTPAGAYSIMDNLINILDVVLAQSNIVEEERKVLSDSEVTGLLYTLAKFMGYYNTDLQEWIYQGDPTYNALVKLSRDDLLRMYEVIMDTGRPNYREHAFWDLKVLVEALTEDGGLVEKIADQVESSTGGASWEELIGDVETLLAGDEFTGSGSLWVTLSDLMNDMLEVIEGDIAVGTGEDGTQAVYDIENVDNDIQKYINFFEEYGFQFNGY